MADYRRIAGPKAFSGRNIRGADKAIGISALPPPLPRVPEASSVVRHRTMPAALDGAWRLTLVWPTYNLKNSRVLFSTASSLPTRLQR